MPLRCLVHFDIDGKFRLLRIKISSGTPCENEAFRFVHICNKYQDEEDSLPITIRWAVCVEHLERVKETWKDEIIKIEELEEYYLEEAERELCRGS